MSREHITPKKSLGQNFLVDKNIAERIVREFDPQQDDLVVEIGPGEGALTGLLLERTERLVAIEIDSRAAELVRSRYGEGIEVIEEDVLRVNFGAIAARYGVERLRVIGNIPYYITSPILFHLFGERRFVSDAMLMMQREVADRLIAPIRTKDYGILSVMTQSYSLPRRLFDVGPRCFHPVPRVTSAVVRLTFRDIEGITGLEETHRLLVRNAFGQRRKTLRNSLGGLLSTSEQRERVFGTSGISETARAEELTPEAFVRLARVYADAGTGTPG